MTRSTAVFNVSIQTSWLKEFFDVDLTVYNNAEDEFSIENAKAVLTLPEGLSLADTAEGEKLVQVMGKGGVIGGTSSASASWIIKGDEPGEYDLEAEFTGMLMPMGESVKTIFKTKEPLVVHDGTGLTLDISVVEGRDYWTNEFVFNNDSGHDINNFAAAFEGYGKLVNFSDMYIIYPDGTIEIAKINEGTPDLENSVIYLPVLSDGDNIYTHRTIKDGQSVRGYFKILREDGYTNDDWQA